VLDGGNPLEFLSTLLLNDDLKSATDELVGIVRAERARRGAPGGGDGLARGRSAAGLRAAGLRGCGAGDYPSSVEGSASNADTSCRDHERPDL
jgi:hypothetical protein